MPIPKTVQSVVIKKSIFDDVEYHLDQHGRALRAISALMCNESPEDNTIFARRDEMGALVDVLAEHLDLIQKSLLIRD